MKQSLANCSVTRPPCQFQTAWTTRSPNDEVKFDRRLFSSSLVGRYDVSNQSAASVYLYRNWRSGQTVALKSAYILLLSSRFFCLVSAVETRIEVMEINWHFVLFFIYKAKSIQKLQTYKEVRSFPTPTCFGTSMLSPRCSYTTFKSP